MRRKAAEAKRVYLGITDRLKDIFRVGGFNCYPAEIEAGLLEHPAIAQVAVPDQRRGDACRLTMCMI
ncbi:Long-chain-fatty-acid--CoA ligase [compost metagenome]